MCGIVGFSGNGDRASLEAALEALRHRGPDDSGIYEDNSHNIGLAHSRLSIQDLSDLGHQPMVSEDNKFVIIFNGEIYNFKDLRDELVQEGINFRGNSDTEVLLHLYKKEGKSMLSRLNGIFAFAVWDKNSNSLFVARDAFGVKPLYYSAEGESFVFSSEIKSLIHLMKSNKELDYHSLDRYISFLWSPGESTPLKEIKKMSPGEAFFVKNGKIEKVYKWYNLPFFRKTKKHKKYDDPIIGTRDFLRKAVHRQMVSDAPLGAFLSGGLDSSSVVAFAKEVNPQIRCFTIESENIKNEGFYDDLPYAKKVAKHLSVPLDIIKINSKDLAHDIEYMVSQLDEPLADPASLNVLYISRLAKENNIKVLLSGSGGDDIFTGYRRHRAIIYEKYWKWLPLSIRKVMKDSMKLLNSNRNFGRRLKKVLSGATFEDNFNIINYFLWAKREDIEPLYTPEFREALSKGSTYEPMINFLSSINDHYSDIEKMLAIEQRFFLTDHNLIYTDKMSMAEGIEVRVPFLDKDLVDFVHNIPHHLKQSGSVGKWVLKKAMEPFLPKEVIYRPKTGFGAPVRRWIKFELKELIGDFLSEDSIKNRGLFEPKAVKQLIKSNELGEIDASYTILSLLITEIWIRRYIDQ